MISIVIILIALNVLFSWQAFEKHELREKMLFIPYNVKHLNTIQDTEIDNFVEKYGT